MRFFIFFVLLLFSCSEPTLSEDNNVFSVHPNPYNSDLNNHISGNNLNFVSILNIPESVIKIDIYDVFGVHINTLFKDGGLSWVRWNLETNDGKLIKEGTYYLKASNRFLTLFIEKVKQPVVQVF